MRDTATIIKEAVDFLFSKEANRLHDEKAKLIQENFDAFQKEDHPFPVTGFALKGHIIRGYLKDRKANALTKLHSSITKRAFKYIEDLELYTSQKLKCTQVMLSVTQLATTFQDVRDSVPECLASILGSKHQVFQLQRINEPAFLVKDNKFLFKQFNEAAVIMNYYAVLDILT